MFLLNLLVTTDQLHHCHHCHQVLAQLWCQQWLQVRDDLISHETELSVSGQSELALGWLRSAQHWLGPEQQVSVNMLVLWDLGMSRYERELVTKHCNTSSPPCSIVHFDWSR